jgi:hypothetical protein
MSFSISLSVGGDMGSGCFCTTHQTDFHSAFGQVFVGEIPCDFHGWVQEPTVLRTAPKTSGKRGRKKKYPRVARQRPSYEVRNLLTYSPACREQSWQRYHLKICGSRYHSLY